MGNPGLAAVATDRQDDDLRLLGGSVMLKSSPWMRLADAIQHADRPDCLGSRRIAGADDASQSCSQSTVGFDERST